jgi:hypothetical protein
LPELKLAPGGFAKWIGMMDDVDVTCMKTVETFRNHPLIPKDVGRQRLGLGGGDPALAPAPAR